MRSPLSYEPSTSQGAWDVGDEACKRRVRVTDGGRLGRPRPPKRGAPMTTPRAAACHAWRRRGCRRAVRAASRPQRAAGASPSSSRAREVSISGTLSAISTHPGSLGCRRSEKVALAAARTARADTRTRRAPRSAASSAGSSTGSAARLNAPRTSRVSAARNAAATSSEWTTWKRRPRMSGTTGMHRGLARTRGSNGPRKR